MKVLFQNHASLLIEKDGHYLLTDPWFEKPAFGSWLPTFPAFIQPSYLAALGDKLSILISHGHDDHLDDQLLSIFDKDTNIITAHFKSPSVLNRLKKIGFHNIQAIGDQEQWLGGFGISSFINESLSHDDAIYLIRSQDGAVIHANDNWHPFRDDQGRQIAERVKGFAREDVLLFTQTNSASGFPLNYSIFSDQEKQRLLKQKVVKMVASGLENAQYLSLPRIFSYAGFATPYVKGEDYHLKGLFPTAPYLKELLAASGIESDVAIEEYYPGDVVNLPGGKVTKAFITGYQDDAIKAKSQQFYQAYGQIDNCISFGEAAGRQDPLNSDWVEAFLEAFNDFTLRRLQGPDSHYTELHGKSFRLTVNVKVGAPLVRTLVFGKGLVPNGGEANKTCVTDETTLRKILAGEALFEDLYTGYNATWARFPPDVYNRDIVMMIVMFSYVYKNRLAPEMCDRYQSQALVA